jgi:tetratricopeptide (TPR) repeat protein
VAAASSGGHSIKPEQGIEEIMKNISAILIVIAATLLFGQDKPAANPSPAERAIAQAQSAIAKKPNQCDGYNQLAIALARRARETSDVNSYAGAEEALKRSLELSPDNLDAEKIHVWLLLGRHQFYAALDDAKALNRKVPDDVLVYGFLVDANAELGNYKDAESAAQWMLNLRPGNLPALTRAAYLRELLGDVDGALELMNMAYQSTPPTENEDGAWILTQMAHLRLSEGNSAEAETLLQQALQKFAGYHYALGNLAKLRVIQHRYAEAVSLLQKRYAGAPHAENLYDLAEALELAGRTDEAKTAFSQFEIKSLGESVRADNSNRELTFYYADHAHQPAKALAVAQKEFSRRHDVYTLDAYAWALHVNGQNGEARKQIEAALSLGIRDANMLHHAGEIALSLGDTPAAEHLLKEAAALNAPGSEQARTTLASLTSSLQRR